MLFMLVFVLVFVLVMAFSVLLVYSFSYMVEPKSLLTLRNPASLCSATVLAAESAVAAVGDIGCFVVLQLIFHFFL
jgi:hypothetical protein